MRERVCVCCKEKNVVQDRKKTLLLEKLGKKVEMNLEIKINYAVLHCNVMFSTVLFCIVPVTSHRTKLAF